MSPAMQPSNLKLRAKIEEGNQVFDKLQERHNLMEYIFRHDPNAIVVHDKSLHYIFASDRYHKNYRKC